MDKVKIAFVGTGFMGQQAHLRNYTSLQECEVVAIAEPRKTLRERIAARYNIPRTYPSHEELLADVQVDGIVASHPYDRHAVLLPDIYRAGAAVFTEKPLAVSVQAAEQLVKLARKNKVLHMVGYHKRSDPAMEYARAVIDDWKRTGVCGKMRLVRACMPPGDWVAGGGQGFIDTGETVERGETEPAPADMDAGTFNEYNAFVNYYIHQVNALRFLLTEPYRVTFAEKTGVLLVAESESGVCATIEMAAYSTRSDWQESFFVAFERGWIRIELPAPLVSQIPGRVWVMQDTQDGPGLICEPMLPRRHAMLNQAANFIQAIRGEKPAPCLAEEALEDLRVAREYINLKKRCGA